jgi:hypothetical protein
MVTVYKIGNGPNNVEVMLLGSHLVEAIRLTQHETSTRQPLIENTDDAVSVQDPHRHDLGLEQAEGVAKAIAELVALARRSSAT